MQIMLARECKLDSSSTRFIACGLKPKMLQLCFYAAQTTWTMHHIVHGSTVHLTTRIPKSSS